MPKLDPTDPGPITPKSQTLRSLAGYMPLLEQHSAVVDPFTFLPYSVSQWGWDTRGSGLFYRHCGDWDRGLSRVPIAQWRDIHYCDYKIYRETLDIDLQRQCLDHWLQAATSLKWLHVSIDDPGVDPMSAVKSLRSLPGQSALIIEVFNRTARDFSEEDLTEVSSLLLSDRVWALDCHRSPLVSSSDHRAWLQDLRSPTAPRLWYTRYQRRLK